MTLEILKQYKIKAKKSLGQNFLVNENIVQEIANQINIEGKNIVEVGPGYGVLTKKLLEKKPKNLTLVELDKDMINIIEDRIKINDININGIKFEIQNIDVLKYEPKFTSSSSKNELKLEYSVIANIPYYITSPILRHFLYDIENTPDKMVILMQKDVGDKIIGGKKNKSSVLSLFIAKKCFVRELLFVGKENFVPEPKVESSVLLFEKHNLYTEVKDEDFLRIIKIGFSSPRKKLLKNLVKGGFEKKYIMQVFEKLVIENDIRGEDLDIAIWCELIKEINK